MATAKDKDRVAAAIQRATDDDEVKSDTVVEEAAGDGSLKVKFRDQEFLVDDEVGIVALMEWTAAFDLDTESNAGMIATWNMLQDVIHPDDWNSFRAYARSLRPKAKPDELMKVINDAGELIGGRPTEPSSGSSGKE